MATVRYCPGRNITESRCDILTNTVNAVSVMGAGVALAFKRAFPQIMPEYTRDCRRGVIRPGATKLYPLDTLAGRTRFWAAMATKDHWRDPSKLEWIDPALEDLADAAHMAGATSIAIPPPGCGHGGLAWRFVEPMVLQRLADFDLEIYASSTIRR